MTADLVPIDPTALDAVADPGAAVVALLEQSKLLLAEATRLEDVTEWRARADALATYTRQRDLGHDAELAALEIVRRAERRIGELIREAQAAGSLRRRGETATVRNQYMPSGVPRDAGKGTPSGVPRDAGKSSPSDYLPTSNQAAQEIYAVTDGVSAEEFERAVQEAKEEGNLSRANVVRKVRGEAPGDRLTAAQREAKIQALADANYTGEQIAQQLGVTVEHVRKEARRFGIEITADTVLGKTRRVDPNRVIAETVSTLEGIRLSLDLIGQPVGIAVQHVPYWIESLGNSIQALNRLRKMLKEANPDG